MPHLFETLGEFAAKRCRPIAAQHLGHVGECFGRAVRRLVDHERRRHGAKLAQTIAARAGLVRQKTEEKEGIGWQAGSHQRRQDGRGAGNGNDADALGDRLFDQFVTGVGNQRRAGVGYQREAHAAPEHGQKARSLAGGVVLVVDGKRLADAVAVEEDGGDAAVLANDEIGTGQHIERAQRDVREIADRRRHRIQAGLDRLAGECGTVDGVARRGGFAGCLAHDDCRSPLAVTSAAMRSSRSGRTAAIEAS